MTEEKKRKATFCLDCCDNPETCGKNPIDCMEEAGLYFNVYDSTFSKLHGIRKTG